MTLYINGYMLKGDLTIVSDKSVIQSGETVSLEGVLASKESGVTVYFFEEYEPTILRLRGDKSVIQSGETLNLSVRLKDEDGSGIADETVYFYSVVD